MNWTEISEPKKGVSYYTHTFCETPLGLCKIEWKSWKEDPDYSIEIGDNYFTTEYSLEEAKLKCLIYLLDKMEELKIFLHL